MFPFLEWIPPEYWGVIGVVVPVLQIAAAVHVLRTGRQFYWIWIILILPPIGAIVYFFVEVYPDLRRGAPVGNPFTALLDWWDPGREYRRLKEALELADTVTNRRALAEYHLRHHECAEAIDLYKGALRGPFKDDPGIHLDLARALFKAGEYPQARGLLEKVQRSAPSYEPVKRDFLLGRVCEEQGDKAAAVTLYEKVSAGYSDEEARVRLALLLEERGETQKAKTIYADVVRRMKKAHRHYRRDQKEWWQTARDRLNDLA